tara:strand:+ start:301 stop:537 length:237 start_codon:yes stop_codon:yes gene_type:complete
MEGRDFAQAFAEPAEQTSAGPGLRDGARVAVVGGGPAGSFFSYFLLDMADRVGLNLDSNQRLVPEEADEATRRVVTVR